MSTRFMASENWKTDASACSQRRREIKIQMSVEKYRFSEINNRLWCSRDELVTSRCHLPVGLQCTTLLYELLDGEEKKI